jgi:HSP20 family protein
MAIYRWTWDPWRDLRHLREEMESAVGRFGRAAGIVGARPPINVFQTDEGLTVTAEVPGVEDKDLTVEAEGDVLRLTGTRKAPEGAADEAFHRRERTTGEFTREIRLPAGLDTDKIEAKLADGILTVHMPKAEAAKPRKIEVKAG